MLSRRGASELSRWLWSRLAKLNPRQAEVVELRPFAGLTEEEAA
jgi:DNA-directed RNA polymerase specialized sigma24 family protein